MRTTEKHFYCPHFKDEKTKLQKIKSIAQDLAISKKSSFKAGSVWLLHPSSSAPRWRPRSQLLWGLQTHPQNLSCLPGIVKNNLSLILLYFNSLLVPEDVHRDTKANPTTYINRVKKSTKMSFRKLLSWFQTLINHSYPPDTSALMFSFTLKILFDSSFCEVSEQGVITPVYR